jgi:hypothetical protein
MIRMPRRSNILKNDRKTTLRNEKIMVEPKLNVPGWHNETDFAISKGVKN